MQYMQLGYLVVSCSSAATCVLLRPRVLKFPGASKSQVLGGFFVLLGLRVPLDTKPTCRQTDSTRVAKSHPLLTGTYKSVAKRFEPPFPDSARLAAQSISLAVQFRCFVGEASRP
jgi:hypothetical protein